MSSPSPFQSRPFPDYFIASPLSALLYPLHHLLLRLRGPPRLPPPDSRPIRIVCISDTHTLQPDEIPDGDLLIHAGDLSNDGSIQEIQASVDWLLQLPHSQKVVVCGNHDSYFDIRSRRDEDRDPFSYQYQASSSSTLSSTASIRSLDDLDGQHRINWGDIHYLQHSSVTLSFPPPTTHSGVRSRSLTLYGAPQIPAIIPFSRVHAFTYPPYHDAWSRTVPPETDILISHSPPQSHLDLSPVFSTGCPFLLSELWRVRPALHVFGHIHAGYGMEPVYWDEAQKAWERICASRRVRARYGRLGSLLGPFRDLFDLSGWVDAARVLVYGVLGVVWKQVWGGENPGCSWLVNAACMVGNSGRLGNRPQVVVL